MGRGWTEAYGSHCKLPVNTDGSDRNQIFVYFFHPQSQTFRIQSKQGSLLLNPFHFIPFFLGFHRITSRYTLLLFNLCTDFVFLSSPVLPSHTPSMLSECALQGVGMDRKCARYLSERL